MSFSCRAGDSRHLFRALLLAAENGAQRKRVRQMLGE